MDLKSLPIEPCPEAVQWLAEHRNGRSPKIWRDRHLKEFIDERLTRLPFHALAALCVEVFGKERAPGRSTLHRYYRMKWHMRPNRLQPRAPQ
jgi:hypothetical protein